MTLTPEVIEEGRAFFGTGRFGYDALRMGHWFAQHGHALLSAAERVGELEASVERGAKIRWHQCGDAVRPYPALICSWCTSGRDFDALEQFEALMNRAAAAERIVHELRQKLAIAGVEGSPPPGMDTTIGTLLTRARAAEAECERLRKVLAQIETQATQQQAVVIRDLAYAALTPPAASVEVKP